MLVLSRKKNERVVIGERQIVVEVGAISGANAELRVLAPQLRVSLDGSSAAAKDTANGWAVASRKKDERIFVGNNVIVQVIEIRGDKVRLGIESPIEMMPHREEVYDAIKREQAEKRETLGDGP